MEWQAYVDNALVAHSAISKAGIFGINVAVDRNAHCVEKWASNNFDPSSEELKVVLTSFIDPHLIVAHGLYLEGVKYVCLSTNTSTILGKRSASGCVAIKTARCIIIAIYDSSKNAQNALCAVIRLADYLRANEF